MEKRLRSKHTKGKEPGSQKVPDRTRVVINSCGEGGQDTNIPAKNKNSITMSDNKDAIKEVGRLMADVVTRQIELQQERDKANSERLTQLLERQENSHKSDADSLTETLEKMRIAKEKDRGRLDLTLDKYDGLDYDIDEWQDRTKNVMTGNFWDIAKHFKAIPFSLNGQTKCAFYALTDENKRTKDSFFQAMRMKIDPQAESRNKNLFVKARRGNNVMKG